MARDLFAERQPVDLFANDAEQPKKEGYYQPEPQGLDALTPEEVKNLPQTALGKLEAGATLASSIVAEPVAGIAGITQAVNPFTDQTGGEAVEATREALTYDPKTPEGRESIKGLAKTLQPIAEILEKAEKASGDAGYDLAGPIGGAIFTAAPTALAELLGLVGAKTAIKATDRVGEFQKATPDTKTGQILEAGEKFDVPVLTTDVAPPKGYLPRLAQSLSEKVGIAGSGTARVRQQAARESAVEAFADNMDIDLDTPFADEIIKEINLKTAKDMDAAGVIRNEAVTKLDEFGDVPMAATNKAIQIEIAKQQRLGAKGNASLITDLEKTADAIQNGDFSLIKDIRTEIISDLRAIGRSEDTRATASIQRVKSAMDDDMLTFAKANDRPSAAKWVKSNRAFFDAYHRTKDTAIKRIIKTGEATPEVIIPLLRSGKPSQLRLIKKSMGKEGAAAARGAIIQDALKDARFFEVDANPNPDAFATALNKPNRRQAINVFFEGQELAELEGFTRMLNATRRAQSGQAVIKTGEQAAVAGAVAAATGAAVIAPQVAIPLMVLSSGAAKLYESTKFRNLLIRLKNTKKGSKQEAKILELASAFAASELQVAKTTQEEEQ